MSNLPENWGFETAQIHAGATPDPTTNAVVTPRFWWITKSDSSDGMDILYSWNVRFSTSWFI